MTPNRSVALSLDRVGPERPPQSNAAPGCPPDLLIRSAVLEPNEAVQAHLSRCSRCTRVYFAALGSKRPRQWPQ